MLAPSCGPAGRRALVTSSALETLLSQRQSWCREPHTVRVASGQDTHTGVQSRQPRTAARTCRGCGQGPGSSTPQSGSQAPALSRDLTAGKSLNLCLPQFPHLIQQGSCIHSTFLSTTYLCQVLLGDWE